MTRTPESPIARSVAGALSRVGQVLFGAVLVEALAIASFGVEAGTIVAVLATVVLLLTLWLIPSRDRDSRR